MQYSQFQRQTFQHQIFLLYESDENLEVFFSFQATCRAEENFRLIRTNDEGAVQL